ncbi:MAG: class I SAM-dependent methyltransferase [Bacteroidales bacterium]|nr:class I SAM-dependent methyltransferase [Bacteroidales bacterium]
MIDEYIHNPKSPKYYVKKYFDSIKDSFKDKVVVDLPAGNGVTSKILYEYGAKVMAFDLFPEYFMFDRVKCSRADIDHPLPIENATADMVICQEGIEHFSDQLKSLKEFNRILKPNGQLIITTPSYSNLAARWSYLLFESETSKQMPPNEIDDIWMSDQSLTKNIYYGHIFLIGNQKLRILAKLAGFDIKEMKYMRLSKGSLVLFPFLYPFIWISSYLRYFRNLKKHKNIDLSMKKKVYQEQLNMNIAVKNLLNKHTFVILQKKSELNEIDFRQDSIIKPFDKLM